MMVKMLLIFPLKHTRLHLLPNSLSFVIKKVVLAMNGDKVPGPDGFSMAFFQACWDILSLDILKVFYDFMLEVCLRRALMFRSFRLFQSFLVLIPSKTFGLLVLWRNLQDYC
jgi:hypothetical protein